MKNLILHIGPHKTGSTYLQLKLMKNREKLNDSGFSYPDQFFHVFGHHHLYTKMFHQNNKDEYLEEVARLNEIDANVILSSENFSTQSLKFYENIERDFKYNTVTVVYYYRAPTDRLYSYWQEQIKHGSSNTLSEYSLPKFSRPYLDKDLNLISHLEMVGKVFGQSSIKILDYEKTRSSNSSVSTFFKAIGCDAPVVDSKEVVNAVLPESLIEVIRVLNAKRRIESGKSDLRLRESVLGSNIQEDPNYLFLKEVIDSSCDEITFGNTHIDSQVYNKILNDYASCIVGELTSPKPKTRRVPSSDWLLNHECQRRIELLYEKLKP